MAVEKTVAKQTTGATIRGFTQESSNGQTTYEVATVINGHTKDIQINADGIVLEVEEQVDLKSLPATAQTALAKKAGKGKITKVESLTKKSRLVAYEAQVSASGKLSEIQVGPAGESLDHEE